MLFAEVHCINQWQAGHAEYGYESKHKTPAYQKRLYVSMGLSGWPLCSNVSSSVA
jgi:hypothetical protein